MTTNNTTTIAEKKANLAAALKAAYKTTEAVRSVLTEYGFFQVQFEGLTPYDMFDNILHGGKNEEENEWFTTHYPHFEIYRVLRQVDL